MLKITKIASLLVLFLLVGMGSYAKTFVKQTQQNSTTSEDKEENKEQSEDEDSQEGPQEEVYQLNLYQAFSLANVQLKWKDFHFEKSGKAFSILPKKRFLEEDSTPQTKVDDQNQPLAAALSDNINEHIALPGFNEATAISTISSKGEIKRKTIAYILNSGTYPHVES